jgi:3-hydroxyacyl-CoA dehydrogenase
MVAKGAMTEEARGQTLGRLAWTEDADAMAANADLVIEAVPEKIELKQSCLQPPSTRGASPTPSSPRTPRR